MVSPPQRPPIKRKTATTTSATDPKAYPKTNNHLADNAENTDQKSSVLIPPRAPGQEPGGSWTISSKKATATARVREASEVSPYAVASAQSRHEGAVDQAWTGREKEIIVTDKKQKKERSMGKRWGWGDGTVSPIDVLRVGRMAETRRVVARDGVGGGDAIVQGKAAIGRNNDGEERGGSGGGRAIKVEGKDMASSELLPKTTGSTLASSIPLLTHKKVGESFSSDLLSKTTRADDAVVSSPLLPLKRYAIVPRSRDSAGVDYGKWSGEAEEMIEVSYV